MRLPNGIELHYIERGQGQPVVLLHGGMGDLHSWERQIDPFARFYRVISYSRRYSFPNRNRLDSHGHNALADAEDLGALLTMLDLAPAHLVGTSYGALVALCFAVAHPQSARSIVLAEPPAHQWIRETTAGDAVYRQFIDGVWSPARQAFAQGSEHDAMRILFDGFWGQPVFELLSSDWTERCIRNVPAMRALALASDPFPDLPKAAFRSFQVPTLLICSEHAVEIHRRVNEEIARVLPHAEQALIPQSSHGSPRENPAAFNAAVLNFLGGVPG